MKKLETKLTSLLLFFFWTLLALGQLGRVQISPTVAFYLHDLLILTLTLWWFRKFSLSKNLKIALTWLKNHRLVLLLLSFILLNGAVATFATGQVIHWLYLARLLIYAFFTWLMIENQPQVNLFGREVSLRGGYLGAGLAITYFGLLQYFLLPDTRFLFILGWDDHYYRLISTQFDPAYTGALLILSFFLTQILKTSWLKIGLRCIVVLAIALTFSRATFLGFGIGLLGYFFLEWQQKKNSWPILLFLPLLLGFIWLAPKPTGEGVNLTRTSTITARTTTTDSFFSELKPWEWMIGRGLFVPLPDLAQPKATDALSDHAHVPDNIAVLLLTGLGLGGTLLVVLLLWQVRTIFLGLPSWVLASLGAILTHSLFNNTLFQPFVWLFICGIVLTSRNLRTTA